MAATKDNNLQVPNPPKAMRGLGLLNPPKVNEGLSSMSPPPTQTEDAEVPTQRLQISLLQPQGKTDEASGVEPLMLSHVRTKNETADNSVSDEERTQIRDSQTGERPLPKPKASDVGARIRAKHRFYDFDEDAVTKKIVVNRIVTVSPNKNEPQTTVRVKTVDEMPDGRQSHAVMTDARYNNPMTPDRPTDLSALGNATKASNRRRSVIPVLRDGIKKVFSIIAPHRSSSGFEPLAESTDSSYQMGANSYSADLYKEMRQAIQSGSNSPNSNLPMPRYTYLVSRPPRIVLKGFLLRREKQTSLMLRGRAIHPLSVRDVMIFADKRKILYLSSAARNDAGCIEFSADIPLVSETSHILVVARHNEEVMGSQSLFVRRDE